MLDYEILRPQGIVVIAPGGSLTADDFLGLNGLVDAYLAEHPRLHGVLIHARSFPGWDSFAGLAAHIRFVRDHQQRIDRVALVTDSPVVTLAEALATPFVAATIRHFPDAEYKAAMTWLEQPGT
jgi:hypothetical protein